MDEKTFVEEGDAYFLGLPLRIWEDIRTKDLLIGRELDSSPLLNT